MMLRGSIAVTLTEGGMPCTVHDLLPRFQDYVDWQANCRDRKSTPPGGVVRL